MQRERKPKNFLPKPVYKGGPKAMGAFISTHLKYPPEALKNKVEGTVVVRIEIDFKGKVLGSKVKSSLGYGCDQEAQRIVELLSFDVHNNVRRGKIIFHKTINIHFRLPVKKAAGNKKAESTVRRTQLSYHIVKKEGKKPSSFNYTITI